MALRLIRNLMLTMNGKGGVGKTSVTANLAAGAAASGWRVLAIDLDPQANLARDLGYLEQSDGGAGLVQAVLSGSTPIPLQRVGGREGLDVLPGGAELIRLNAELQRALIQGQLGIVDQLSQILQPLAGNYDVIIADMGPTTTLLHTAALRAAHFILIPTSADDGSIDGLGAVAALIGQERGANPLIEVLGVVLTLVPSQAKAVERETRGELRELLGDDITVFEAMIRHATVAARACRKRGLTASEYEAAALDAKHQRLRRLRHRDGPAERAYSEAAPGLADDYQRLTEEVFARFAERMSVAVTQ